MTYEKEGLVNPDAYVQGEQGGVAHLVHGWIMQNQKDRVIYRITLPGLILLIKLSGTLHIKRHRSFLHVTGRSGVLLLYDQVYCRIHCSHVLFFFPRMVWKV